MIYPLGGGRFTLFWPSHSPYGSGHIAEGETAAEAVELLVRHLPAGCGPAIDGTAEDLGRLSP